VVEYESNTFLNMFRMKALVLKLVQTNARNKGHCQSDLLDNVNFIAQFEVTNSTLVCTLQDRLQAHHLVPGRELLLSVVGVRDDGCSLLVDIEEGPRASLSALPVVIAEVNQYTEAATRLTKKRLFFDEVCETRNASARQ
jgi:hypothetical protein